MSNTETNPITDQQAAAFEVQQLVLQHALASPLTVELYNQLVTAKAEIAALRRQVAAATEPHTPTEETP